VRLIVPVAEVGDVPAAEAAERAVEQGGAAIRQLMP